MFRHHQDNMKSCKVLSHPYSYYFEPLQPLSLKHLRSDVSKVSKGSGLKTLGGTLGLSHRYHSFDCVRSNKEGTGRAHPLLISLAQTLVVNEKH